MRGCGGTSIPLTAWNCRVYEECWCKVLREIAAQYGHHTGLQRAADVERRLFAMVDDPKYGAQFVANIIRDA
jgi:hypothetical protein